MISFRKDKFDFHLPRQAMAAYRKLRHRLRVSRSALIAGLTLIATNAPFAPTDAAEPITLKIGASRGLPGLHHSALSRFLTAHMAEAGLTDWRFEPAEGDVSAPDRVEWTFRLNPYAGGEVRNFARIMMDERTFHRHCPITIEARLYRNGQYQILVERQAIINEGRGPEDPDLADAVANVTQSLLGPSGAYRAIDTRQRPDSRAR
jgi:hypothetical protein